MTIDKVIRIAESHSKDTMPHPLSRVEIRLALKCLKAACEQEWEGLTAVSEFLVPTHKKVWAWNATVDKVKPKRKRKKL